MKERFKQAYRAAAPDPRIQERIFENVKAERQRRSRSYGRKLLVLAAAVAALSCGAFAAWQGWLLPAPKTYEPDPDSGIYRIESETVYNREETLTTQPVSDDQPLEDGFFLDQAVQVLAAVGLEDADTGRMRLVRRENLAYGRQEVEVSFEDARVRTCVRFAGADGKLLAVTSIDWLAESAAVQDDPARLAREYYEKLPVAQGYVQMEEPEIYDEQYWSYSFCRQVQPRLYSYYEMVRIAVNPLSGRLVGCNVFSFPLLDDHGPEDVPLTREEAIALALELKQINPERYALESAELAVVLPNWFFTEHSQANLQYSEVSRLGWVIRLVVPDSQWGEQAEIWIDYYTGQVLGGDMV